METFRKRQLKFIGLIHRRLRGQRETVTRTTSCVMIVRRVIFKHFLSAWSREEVRVFIQFLNVKGLSLSVDHRQLKSV